MKDIHKEKPDVKIPIKKVGIKSLKYPITVMDKTNGIQHTTAVVSMFVDLPHHLRGTHMSRFVEIFRKYRKDINYKGIKMMLDEMKEKFKAACSHIEIYFPYFIEKESPVTKSRSMMSYNAKFICSLNKEYE
jgi:GTP cyclohydrolase I